MARFATHKTKIIGRGDQTDSKVVLPEAICQHPWGERVGGGKDPLGQSCASLVFVRLGGQRKRFSLTAQKLGARGLDFLTLLLRIPAKKNMLLLGRIDEVSDPPQMERCAFVQLAINLSDLAVEGAALLLFFGSRFAPDETHFAMPVVDRFPVVRVGNRLPGFAIE